MTEDQSVFRWVVGKVSVTDHLVSKDGDGTDTKVYGLAEAVELEFRTSLIKEVLREMLANSGSSTEETTPFVGNVYVKDHQEDGRLYKMIYFEYQSKSEIPEKDRNEVELHIATYLPLYLSAMGDYDVTKNFDLPSDSPELLNLITRSLSRIFTHHFKQNKKPIKLTGVKFKAGGKAFVPEIRLSESESFDVGEAEEVKAFRGSVVGINSKDKVLHFECEETLMQSNIYYEPNFFKSCTEYQLIFPYPDQFRCVIEFTARKSSKGWMVNVGTVRDVTFSKNDLDVKR